MTEPIIESAAEALTPTWLKFVHQVGFPVAATLGIAWFANSAITWEREKMLPALEANSKAIETNSEVLRQLPSSLRKAEDQAKK